MTSTNIGLYRPPSALQPSPAEIAEWTGGTPADIENAPERITGLSTLQEARPDELSFLAAPSHKKAALASAAGLLLAPPAIALDGRPRIVVDHVWKAVAEVMRRLYPDPPPVPGVHPTAFVDNGAKLGKDVSIGPFCSIGRGAEIGDGAILGPHCSVNAQCRIGEASRLYSNVTLQSLVHVGARAILHSGVVLGADGFKFEAADGRALKIPQVGIVIIEDDVEIGANSAVDRAFLHETRIGAGTKIDNLVQIGHNCRIGRSCLIAGCVGMAGSVTMEDGVLVGGGSSFRDGITIGRGAMIGGASVIGKDVEPGAIILGYPAIGMNEFLRASGHFAKLPQIVSRVQALEKILKELNDREPAA